MTTSELVQDKKVPMTIEQLRVAVAKDVLKLSEGTYFTSPDSDDLRELGSQELQCELLDSVPECRVCALGLSAISLVRVKDSIILGEDLVGDADGVARDELGGEWASIVEAAFEGWALDSDEDGIIDRRCTLLPYRIDIETRERARLIMEAVIETEGDEDQLLDKLFEKGE